MPARFVLIFLSFILFLGSCDRQDRTDTPPSAAAKERWLSRDLIFQIESKGSALIDEERVLLVNRDKIKKGFVEGIPVNRLMPSPGALPIELELLDLFRNGFPLKQPPIPVSTQMTEIYLADDTELPKGQYNYILRYRLKNLVFKKEGKEKITWAFLEENPLDIDSYKLKLSFEDQVTAVVPSLVIYDARKIPPEKKASFTPFDTSDNIIRYNLGPIPAQHFLELQLQWDKAVDGK